MALCALKKARRDGRGGQPVLVSGQPLSRVRNWKRAEEGGFDWRISAANIVPIAQRRRYGHLECDGAILFGGRGAGPIERVSASGGTPTAVTALGQGETFHTFPVFLPDQRHFVYLRSGNVDTRGIYVGSLDAKPAEQSTKRLVDSALAAAFAPSANSSGGNLLFLRGNTLMAQPFDVRRFDLGGRAGACRRARGRFRLRRMGFGFLEWNLGRSSQVAAPANPFLCYVHNLMKPTRSFPKTCAGSAISQTNPAVMRRTCVHFWLRGRQARPLLATASGRSPRTAQGPFSGGTTTRRLCSLGWMEPSPRWR